jgi:hypothetical protein
VSETYQSLVTSFMRLSRRNIGGSLAQLQENLVEKHSLDNSWATSLASLGQCWNMTLPISDAKSTQSAIMDEDSPRHTSPPEQA